MSSPDHTDHGRRTTLRDVAQAAGVGISTASRALRGSGYVASDVKDRILASARELNYVPDPTARTLRAGTSHEIGVLISNLLDPFYAEFAAGVERQLAGAGYHMILVNHNGDETQEREAVRSFIAMRVAGAIVIPVSTGSVAELADTGIPVVQADRVVSKVETDAVVGSNAEGGFAATEYLLALGHTRIAMLIDEAKWTTGAGRLQGFRDAHAEAGVPVDEELVVFCDSYMEAARDATIGLIRTHPDITAIFALNNVLAAGAFHGITSLGLTIPTDLSLIAYDDVPWMSMVQPQITTISQHNLQIGQRSAELMLARVRTSSQASSHPVTIRMEPSLVVRKSVSRPAKH